MKILQKILIVLITAICILGFMPQNVSRAETLSEIVDNFSADSNVTNKMGSGLTNLQNIIGKFLGFLQVASALMSIVIIAVTGFNYIVATPNVKQGIKETMFPIVMGLVILFGAVSIAKFIVGAIEG